jgi:hypothetical protein
LLKVDGIEQILFLGQSEKLSYCTSRLRDNQLLSGCVTATSYKLNDTAGSRLHKASYKLKTLFGIIERIYFSAAIRVKVEFVLCDFYTVKI